MAEENFTSSYTVGQYLKRVSDTFKNGKKKSLTEILQDFQLISNDYQKFYNTELPENSYSSNDFLKCSREEQFMFYNDQLQFIECLVINSIYEKVGLPWNWGDILKLLINKQYAQVEKIQRKVVYPSSGNNRPIGDVAYSVWNGVQIIDLDIKDYEIADKLKTILFNELKKYSWFLGVYKSASGKGLHLWTKIKPISIELENRRIEYLCNFRHKYSYVYIILSKYMKELNYTQDDIIRYIDMAMAKPQQGIFISSDFKPLINTNFKDVRLDVNFETALNTGIESVNWLSHPDLKQVFSKLEWFTNEKFDKATNIDLSDISNVGERNLNKAVGKKHYKHAQRWQLANTLTHIYGEEQALKIMIEICKGTDRKELKGDVKTASIHNKPISMWAVTELNKQHGFNIKISAEIYSAELEKLSEELNSDNSITTDIARKVNDSTQQVVLNINSKQYLGDIKDDILANLSKMTLLEAGAGYGKTEMIKAFKAKTLLVLPFTSTIKAKVETSDTTKDWLYYYGNKRPTLDELLGDKSMTMTIDKFSHLNIMELDTADFKYIVIDESHLLFTSSYRDVMSPCIQRLANCKAKVILMTGTPTGEMLFFPNIRHIKVKKEDLRQKTFDVFLVPTKTEQLCDMCESMANDVINGRKILFPTNKGNLFFEQVKGIVSEYLRIKGWDQEFKAFYYKKSNYGDETMDNININKSIGNNHMICCTTYLSVGVDICDRSQFSVYFNEPMISQDIEQFANRLRNNDLFIKLYLPKLDSDGNPIRWNNTQPLDLELNDRDLLFARDTIRTCNDMIERNNEDSKYNPIIQNILATNNYLKYDENDCRYYIDETTYKLHVFEERYSSFAKQLNILEQAMKDFGYVASNTNSTKQITQDKKDQIEEFLKECRHKRFDEHTIHTMNFLNHINDANIDMYRELLKGNYSMFKDDEYRVDRETNGIWAEDIEVMERNLPIIFSLYRFYDCDTIKDIYKFCVDRKLNRMNYSKLQRIRNFVRIEYNREKNRLDFPVLKYVKDAQKWAKANPVTTQNDINIFNANYAAAYCNSIENVVVENIELLQKIYEIASELWKVVIVQQRPKNGQVTILPFELEWDRKDILENVYGNVATREFFLQELVNNVTTDEVEEETPGEFEIKSKLHIEDVQSELKNIVHATFDYDNYSKEDGSNDRFMRKQENQNQLRDNIFVTTTTTDLPTTDDPESIFNSLSADNTDEPAF